MKPIRCLPAGEPVTSLADLPPDEPRTWTCGELTESGQPCGMFIQGGLRGLALHTQTVHPARQADS